MPRESVKKKRARALEIMRRLHGEYPDAATALHHASPYELLVATILSAQTTDERVNEVTPRLFTRFPTAADLADADREEVEELIHSTGFFRNKAKAIVGMAKGLVERHGGEVPRDMESLTALPGVGRKTANVVAGNAWGTPGGVVVDTHVKRLSRRLGLTAEKQPDRIEQDLNRLIPEQDWVEFPHLLILHGRRVCIAREPRCAECVVSDLCPSSRV